MPSGGSLEGNLIGQGHLCGGWAVVDLHKTGSFLGIVPGRGTWESQDSSWPFLCTVFIWGEKEGS